MTAKRSLGLLDLVLFNTVAIVGLRWVALAGHSGPSSLTLWLLAALAFFIPQGLCVMTLSSALPKDGGLYVWISEAFGESRQERAQARSRTGAFAERLRKAIQPAVSGDPATSPVEVFVR